MKGLQIIVALAVVFGPAGLVHGDLSPAPWPTSDLNATATVGSPSPQKINNQQSTIRNSCREQFTPLFAADNAPDFFQFDIRNSESEVKQLPPAPDSAALFLCGLGTLGALQLTRSAKKLHWGNVPSWFHTGGPAQIGNSHALNLDLIDALPVCWFDQPTGERPVLLDYIPSEPQPRFGALCLLTTTSPRAPPLLCA